MKPAAFEYVCPDTLEEALSYLDLWGDSAKILAGGQSLVPLLNMRLAQPQYIIDINRLPGLSGITRHPDTRTVEIGALVRHHQLISNPILLAHASLLSEAARYIGHIAIRSRGTIGGSIAHADPSGELPLAVTALRGHLKVRSRHSQRTIPIEDFFGGYYMTALEPNELIYAVEVLESPIRTGCAVKEFQRRHGDFALASAAAAITVDECGAVLQARVAVGGVAPNAVTCSKVEEALCGQTNNNHFSLAAELVAQHIDPPEDIQASADYRRHLAIALAAEAIDSAYERALWAKEEA